MTVDARKGLFLPYSVGALLVRDPALLIDSHEGWGSYLRGIPTIEGLPHYFQRGPELTRPNRVALIWFPLQSMGPPPSPSVVLGLPSNRKVKGFTDDLDPLGDLSTIPVPLVGNS